MQTVIRAGATALAGAAIVLGLWVWGVSLDRDYLLGEMNLGPLYFVGAVGAALFVWGFVGLIRAFAGGHS